MKHLTLPWKENYGHVTLFVDRYMLQNFSPSLAPLLSTSFWLCWDCELFWCLRNSIQFLCFGYFALILKNNYICTCCRPRTLFILIHLVKQRREMTKFEVMWTRSAHEAKRILVSKFLIMLIHVGLMLWQLTLILYCERPEANDANLYFRGTSSLLWLHYNLAFC